MLSHCQLFDAVLGINLGARGMYDKMAVGQDDDNDSENSVPKEACEEIPRDIHDEVPKDLCEDAPRENCLEAPQP